MSNNTIVGSDILSKKERNSLVYLVVYLIALAFFTFSGSPFASTFVLVMIFIFAFYNKYLSLVAYVGAMIFYPEFSVAEVFVCLLELSVVGVSIILKMPRKILSLFIITSIFIILMFVAMGLGAKSKPDTLLLFGFNLYTIVFISQMVVDTNEKLIINTLVFSGLIISLYVGYTFLFGNVEGLLSGQGRLTYQGTVKTLATTVVVPVFVSINKFLDKDSRKKKGEIYFYILVFAICFPVLLLTYARGVTIALVVASFFLVIHNSKGFNFSYLIMLAIVLVAVMFFVDRLEMNRNLWFDNIEGGNGRTEVYQMYYNYMKNQGPQTIIWGIGSINMKDILGWNPHSTLLAYFFHFGVWGALFVIYEIFITMVGLYRQRKELGFYLCLFILNVIMFSSHGTFDSILYCFILGVCYGMINKKKKYEQNSVLL